MRRLRLGIITIFILFSMVLTACAGKQNNISISTVEVLIDDTNSATETLSDRNESELSKEESDEENEEEIEEATEAAIEYASIEKAKVGDTIVFGKYEQDGVRANGKEPIEWIVLKEDDDNILVLSRYVIDKKPFNETDKKTGWEQSSLRKWLNGEFIKAAFTDKEAERIVATQIDNPGSTAFFKEFNSTSGIAAGRKTKDSIFLLSYEEVLEFYKTKKIDKFFVYVSKELITTATDATGIENKSLASEEYETFYKEEGWPEDCVGINGSGWFLRSNGINSDDVMSVGYDGTVRAQYLEYGADYENVAFEGGIRPAMWISKTNK